MITKEVNKKTKKLTSTKGLIKYPYISFNRLISNGTPIINGTRTTVRTIAGYYQLGMNVDEILSSLSHLRPSQVHSALAYYFDHQEEIDSEIRENNSVYNAGLDE
ncbi:MAG: DUF433 domain-containing protein [bacterium]